MNNNMNERNYLTESIFLFKDKLFYEKKGIKEVKNHNWHHILRDYGWEKLHKQWIKKLNTYLEKPINNSLYGCLDCGSDGDCLFHCISYAINNNLEKDYDSNTLRKNISDSLSEERYNELIEFYKIMNCADDFDEEWDPEKMTIQKFKELIIRGGNEYWGDFLMVNLIKEYLNINLIILNSNEIDNEYYNYPLFYEYDPTINSIILVYENESHFKLVGYFQNNTMNTFFNQKTIPNEILKLINYLR